MLIMCLILLWLSQPHPISNNTLFISVVISSEQHVTADDLGGRTVPLLGGKFIPSCFAQIIVQVIVEYAIQFRQLIQNPSGIPLHPLSNQSQF